MAMNLWGIIKGLLVQDETDRSKEFSLEVDPSATPETRTTLKAVQTADRNLALPDTSGTLVEKTVTDGLNTRLTTAEGEIDTAQTDITNLQNRATTDETNLTNETTRAEGAESTIATNLANHISNPTGAHAASAISNTPSGNLTATNAQAALNQLQTEIDNLSTGTGTASNVGTGAGQVFKQKIVSDFQFKTIKAGANIDVTNNTDDITLDLDLGSTIIPLANGGTGQSTANAALNALLPSQTSNSGKFLTTDGTNTSWGTVTLPTAWSRVMGAKAVSNTTNPTFQIDMTADTIVLANSSGSTIVRRNPGTFTVNKNTAGPAANGRDQSAAFSASTFIHSYWIWNGTTLATILSASDPTVGPTLPSGYTHWAYHGAYHINAVGDLNSIYQRGSWVYYANAFNFGSGLAATSPTDVGLTNLTIPTNALNYSVRYSGQLNSTSGGLIAASFLFYSAGSTIFSVLDSTWTGLGASNPQIIFTGAIILPNFNNNFRYSWSITNGTSPQMSVYCQGYQIPNGGE